jgi:hypothetical protein
MGALSLFTFLGFLIAVPIIIIKLPAEYFLKRSTPDEPDEEDNKKLSVPQLFYVVFKNFFGIIFVLAGIAMLFLPGQGVVTLLIGMSLLSIPGKHRLMLKIVRQKNVMHSLNRLRAKFNKPAFRMPQ